DQQRIQRTTEQRQARETHADEGSPTGERCQRKPLPAVPNALDPQPATLIGVCGLVPATGNRSCRPGQRWEKKQAERGKEGRREPGGILVPRCPVEHHERRNGVEAPAIDLAVLDLRRQLLVALQVLP